MQGPPLIQVSLIIRLKGSLGQGFETLAAQGL